MQVRQIVTESLNANGLGHYASQAEPVIAELERVVEHAVDSLREQGVSLGASPEQVEQVLVEAGLVERTPEPTDTGDRSFEERVEEALDSLASQVAALNRAARRAGVTV